MRVHIEQSGCPTAVVFDWDGTVFDTDFLIDAAIERVISRHDPDELRRLEPFFYTSKPHTSPLRTLRLPLHGREAIIKEIAGEVRILEKEASAFSGAKEFIHCLLELAVPLAVLTNRDRASLSEQLQRSALDRAFGLLVCRGEVPPKPDPAGLTLIRKKLLVERIVMIGNSMDDLLCARNAGAEFIAVNLCTRVREPQVSIPGCRIVSNYNAVQKAVMDILRH